jgi:hypothetical protein
MSKIALKQIEGINELAQIAQSLAGIDLSAIQQTYETKLNLIGSLSPFVGTAKWSPAYDVTLINAYFILGKSDTAPVTVRIKKNGAALFELTAQANNFKSAIATFSINENVILASDYLTVDVVQASNSENLTIILERQKWQ